MNHPPRILVVDDDVHVLDAMQRQLRTRFDVGMTPSNSVLRGGPGDENLRASVVPKYS
jgi:hypothetical protein